MATTVTDFAGPWSTWEVLREELSAIGREVGRPPASPWSVQASDILDPKRTKERLSELQFYGELASRVQSLATDDRTWITRVRDLLTRRKSRLIGVAEEEDRLRAASLAKTFNTALTLPVGTLLRLCAPLLRTERGRALARGAPDLDGIRDEQRESTRLRFNRAVLEEAFAGHLRSVDDRELTKLFDRLSAERRTAPEECPDVWALCLSGGGIRSASFGLGVLEQLAARDMLDRFDYVSTVSGGGYIGSWLSAWLSREKKDAVLRDLAEGCAAPLHPEAAPVRHLRQYSRYLSPHAGVAAPDMWTLVATVLRNMLLNWLVILPMLAGSLTAPFVAAAVAFAAPEDATAQIVWAWLLAGIGFFAAVTGVWFVHSRRPKKAPDGAGQSMRALAYAARYNSERAFLWACLLPIAVAVVTLNTLWYWLLRHPATAARFPLASGTLYSTLLGIHLAFRRAILGTALFGVGVHVLGWSAAKLQVWRRERPSWGALVSELGAIATSGAIAGAGIFALGIGVAHLARSLQPGLSLPLKEFTMAAWSDAAAVFYSVFAFSAFILALVLASWFYVGWWSRNRTDEEREWSARYTAWLLLVAAAWVVVAVIVVASGWLLNRGLQLAITSAGAVLGGLSAYAGHSASTPAKANGKQNGAEDGLTPLVTRLVISYAAPLAAIAILVAIAGFDVMLLRRLVPVPGQHPAVTISLVGVGLIAFSLFASRRIDVNKFSLHAMYRARLIRAYLGASRPAGTRNPDPFTGFDPDDNPTMASLLPKTRHTKPLHVVNVTVNLTAGSELGWQDRKARSMTITPLFAGAIGLGYRRTQSEDEKLRYGGDNGITLGTAMAISGAAASPNMGYHSSPAVSFLMTMFNARLGWWLGNPGWRGRSVFHDANPTTRVSRLFAELTGRTRDSSSLVYLSDAGHFENLGLYEMVLRRCRVIVVCDAGCDPRHTFEDLGNAIRKIRIDFGISIDMPWLRNELRPRGEDGTLATDGRHVSVGRIRYRDAHPSMEDGYLIYIKAALTGDEPPDVLSYATKSPSFPHESTADQFFSEPQLESYRALGQHSVGAMFAPTGDPLRKLPGEILIELGKGRGLPNGPDAG